MINSMLAGAIAMTSWVLSLFFLKFWKTTGDKFFLFFATAFLLEGFNRILLGLTALPTEDVPIYYLIRVVSYSLILYAIYEKNKNKRSV